LNLALEAENSGLAHKKAVPVCMGTASNKVLA